MGKVLVDFISKCQPIIGPHLEWMCLYLASMRISNLHHEEDSVEDDKGHDKVLEGGADHHPPQLVLEAVPLPRHVALKRLGINRKIDACFLKGKYTRINCLEANNQQMSYLYYAIQHGTNLK